MEYLHPVPLVIAALLGLCVLLLSRRGASYAKGRRRVLNAARLAAVILLVALAGGLDHRGEGGSAGVAVLVDNSPSMEGPRRGFAEEFAKELQSAAKDGNEMSVVTSGGWPVGDEGGFSGTNLELAVEVAAARLKPGRDSRLVVLSDGGETAGRVLNAVPTLRERGIRVMAVNLSVLPVPEVAVERLTAPRGVNMGEAFEIRGTVTSGADEPVTVVLERDGIEEARRELELFDGTAEVVFGQKAGRVGPVEYRLVAETREGDHPANNARTISVVVEGDAQVTLVTTDPAESSWLVESLRLAGLKVSVCTPETCPLEWERHRDSDVFVLDEVPARALGQEMIARLELLVKKEGKGLLAVGGAGGLGAGGYKGTVLERFLPVSMGAPAGAPEARMGLAIVLDTSLSMIFNLQGITRVHTEVPDRKIDVAKAAIIGAIRALRPGDELGLLTSADRLVWRRRIGPVGDREALEEMVSRIGVIGGGINFYSSLLEAFQEIRIRETPIRHVMIVCDSNDIDQYEVEKVGRSLDLVRRMAAEGVSLSIFAIGRAADKDIRFLRTAASLGKGDYYQVSDLLYLPHYFISDYQQKRETWIREERFTPLVKERGSLLRGIEDLGFPALTGVNLVTTKKGAREVLLSPFGSPVFAYWTYGRGRTAVFTGDSGRRWSSHFKSWPYARQFWAQAIYTVSPRPPAPNGYVRASFDGGEKGVVFDVQHLVPPEDDRMEAVELGGGSVSLRLPLERTGLASYRTEVPGLAPGDSRVRMLGRDGGESATGWLAIQGPEEYRPLAGGYDVLDRLVERTGGKWIETVEEALEGLPPRSEPGGGVTLWLALGTLLALLGEFVLRY